MVSSSFAIHGSSFRSTSPDDDWIGGRFTLGLFGEKVIRSLSVWIPEVAAAEVPGLATTGVLESGSALGVGFLFELAALLRSRRRSVGDCLWLPVLEAEGLGSWLVLVAGCGIGGGNGFPPRVLDFEFERF